MAHLSGGTGASSRQPGGVMAASRRAIKAFCFNKGVMIPDYYD